MQTSKGQFPRARFRRNFLCPAAAVLLLASGLAAFAADPSEELVLKLWRVPDTTAITADSRGMAKIIELYRKEHPEIVLQSTAGISIPQIGGSAQVLMAIAGGLAPDVLDCAAGDVYAYVDQRFLVALDDYVNARGGPDFMARAPKTLWDAARLKGPDGQEHLYGIPAGYSVASLKIRYDLLQKFGYTPDTMPKTWDELYEAAQRATDPDDGRYGIVLPKGLALGGVYQQLLVCAGGRAMESRDGELYAAYDTEEGVLAMDFLWKLMRQKWERDGKTHEGVAYSDVDVFNMQKRGIGLISFYTMWDVGMMRSADRTRFLLTPMPAAPNGKAVPLLKASYYGVFAGQKDERVRQAAFDYIWLVGSNEGRRLMTETYVELEVPTLTNPLDLERFGFKKEIEKFPKGYLEFFRSGLQNGYVEPAGPGGAEIQRSMSNAIQAVLAMDLNGLDADARQARIRAVLHHTVADTNQRLHGHISSAALKARKTIALLSALLIFAFFVFQVVLVQRAYAVKMEPLTAGDRHADRRAALMRFARIAFALLPAMALVAMWQYYPLFKGTLIAFQDYRFLGGARFVGVDNFMAVIWSPFFWAAMARTFIYVFLGLFFGFFTPIFLAIMLHELPRGTVLYRVLYYLPALTSGIVVMFLWKSFYEPGSHGYFNFLISFLNMAPRRWLEDPNTAMLWCVLPVVWAGVGPASLIYQAALKSIPDDLFEAAAIDGAGFWQRVRYVAVPYLKPLIVMNFIGAFVGTFQSSGYILLLTGGGPDNATMVVSLEIFYEAYARLSFGMATAMSWILAFSLIGFTLFQIRYLSRIEFRSAKAR